tara:strand:- start:30661 stop:31629 length:969 start_codon:yes stop_codon:yes gene_type:complete
MAFLLNDATSLLERSHQEGRLAHAYLITGGKGSGKTEMTLRLLRMVGHEATTLDDAAGDFVQIVRPESKSRRIKVDAMRALEKRMHLAAPRAETKVGIILDAERLMPEAANAFLKTLEEPPPQSLLLLVSSQPEQLLETILSRCIKIPLHSNELPIRSKGETMLLEALSQHFQADRSKGLAGALGFMQAFTSILKNEKEELKKRYEADLRSETSAYSKTTEGDWLKRREEHYKSLVESDYLQRRNTFIQILIDWYGDALRLQRNSDHLDLPEFRNAVENAAQQTTEAELLNRLTVLENLRSDLNTNVSEGLALECGFLAAYS